ncbi:hypothetical protein KDA_17550 [Dictyobacter alpinus]|uniref:Uncharacterized protein n=2 Tax=Dictyobacter alpinus TaxID=2014873 RepID=A0A402B4K7_9CHLR|nr:hypothetical protein KDA_17550 [Dictyobacter alpinus]
MIIGSILGIYFDLKALRMYRQLGSTQRWYQRPTLMNASGSLLLLTFPVLSIAMVAHILPENIFIYILGVCLLLLAFTLVTYGFILSLKARKGDNLPPQVRAMIEEQKNKNS